MNFLSPIWLFAITAISIPVIIHLWNIRPGKTLKVGSITLIEASSRKRSRSLKLLDLLLLVSRCLLLILIAFVLAMPYFKQLTVDKKSKGWLLVPKENFKEAYQQFKSQTDSLIKAGYEFHYFNSGFQKTTIKQALADTTKPGSKNLTSYWGLLRQLNQQIPASLPVYLVTPGLLKNFTGSRPDLSLKLQWHTYIPADSTDTWIQSAWFTANKDVHVIQGASKPTGTVYNTQNINSDVQQNSPYTISINNGKPFISLKNNNQKPFTIDTATLTIEVYADNNSIDANYINAALETVSQFTQRKIVIKPYSNDPVKKDWLFWLSEKPVNKNVSDRFNDILAYEGGKATTVNSWISDAAIHSVSQGQQLIPLHKSVSIKTDTDEIIWHDGFGSPVLSRGIRDKTEFYHFYSRFNPSWNELVWNANFPKMMLQLILGDKSSFQDLQHDRRLIDSKQIKPESILEESILQGGYAINKDLMHYFWLVAALIFLAERFLAHKKSIGEREKVR